MKITYKELELWANKWGYRIEKRRGRIRWWKEPFCSSGGSGVNIDDIATDIFNHITNDAWVEYQEEYASRPLQEDVYIPPPE